MKKVSAIVVSLTLASGLMSGIALAKSGHGDDDQFETTAQTQLQSTDTTSTGTQDPSASTDPSVTPAPTADQAPADEQNDDANHGRGHNHVPKGLLHAIQNVKDKPAGSVIANILLTQYGSKLTDEQKAELEAIVQNDAALSKAADLLDQQGSVTEAVYMEKEAIRANVRNMDSYIKLGKLYEKTGKKGTKLYINGEEPTMEVPPIIANGRTLVPFRVIAEVLNAKVTWDPADRSVTVTRGDTVVKLFIDSKTATINGQSVQLDVPASIKNGRTLIPVRFLSEALKADVQWEPTTQSVVVNDSTTADPTATPAPTTTTDPTATPAPTDTTTADPTATPAPTTTADPTATPAPTDTTTTTQP